MSDSIILFPDIKEMCKSHKPKRLPYIERVDWAEKQIKNGLNQRRCQKCKRWFFPSEF